MKRITLGPRGVAAAIALVAVVAAAPARAEGPGATTLSQGGSATFGGSFAVGAAAAARSDVATAYRPAFSYRLAETAPAADVVPPPFFVIPLAERDDGSSEIGPPTALPSLESVLSRVMTPESMVERRLALAPMIQGLTVLGLRIRGSL